MPKLSSADITSLCDAAKAAWDAMPPSRSKAAFEWRGKQYVARHSTFRLLVEAPDGKPVAARYD